MKNELKSEARFFSHLEFSGNQLVHQPGSVLGSTALVAGTTIGAGILALPTFTLSAGVVPSTTILIVVWIYTLFSGLLIAEVILSAMRLEGLASIGFLAVVEKTLGKTGARIASIAYLFMHYALLVAYITQGGEILISALMKFWGVSQVLPPWLGTTTFTVFFGGMMYLGRERWIQKVNSAFMGMILISFFGLLWLGGGQVQSTQLLFQDWSAVGSGVSAMFVALFYHNVIPIVVTQLEGDTAKIRQAIIMGSGIPLLMFLAWNAVILGSISPHLLGSNSVFDPLQVLRAGGAGEWLGVLVTVFSELAIVTSFIGFVYGLLDVLKDMSFITQIVSSRLPLYSLILFPPLSFGTLNPSIFFIAIDYTGTFSISVLGVILPALMSWKQRQQLKLANIMNQPLVPGGRLTLTVMIAVALVLMGKQIFLIWGS